MSCSLKVTHQRIAACLRGVGLGDVLEPFAHVQANEALRHKYEPPDLVRLLVIAESARCKSDHQFASTGPGLVYNPRHKTPWWGDWIIPSFGGMASNHPRYRERCLKRLQTCGVYILDASIIPLSGYDNRNPAWGSRALREYGQQVMRDSWVCYNASNLDRILRHSVKPVIVLYTCARDLLGNELRADVATTALPVNFPKWGDTTYYHTDKYEYGTKQFEKAAKLAGLDRCLRNIYSDAPSQPGTH